MHYGEPLDDARWIASVRHAWERGVRTFITADVYGGGQADTLLGRALEGFPRDSYCLIGSVGHDFYGGPRDGAKGFPRFTDSRLRAPEQFASYLRMATEKSLERLKVDHLDVLLLHNPDQVGYTQDKVWLGLEKLAEVGLTRKLGIAPGPANGFTLDLLLSFERFGPLIDWAMIILNPLEPWPGTLCLPAAAHHQVQVVTRVVDYGGIFHDDVKPGHVFGTADHRSFRPPGWVEAGVEKLDQLRPIAERLGLTPLQFACSWNLAQPAVQCVAPTLIQEVGANAKSILTKIDELASLPEVAFTDDDLDRISRIGDNRGCMSLKGANRAHTRPPEADGWGLNPDLESVGRRWSIDPDRDLVLNHS
jgi:aryl-alcohol dehydrogenase-like predicted oxidoreductase